MTSPGQAGKPPPTSNVYDDVYGVGSSFGQELTPEKVRRLLIPPSNPLTAAVKQAGQFFSSALTDIASAVLGKYQGSDESLLQISDGQLELSDRLELLSPLLDYCSVSTPPGSGDARKGTGRMPFDYQIGPKRSVSLVGGALRLEEPGLWDLRAMVTASWVAVGGDLRAYLRVLRPDGTIFSEQGCFASTLSSQTLTLVSSVVVPAPGYYVDVWVTSAGIRGWWTGPQWTRLTAQRISSGGSGGTGGEESATPDDEPDEDPVDDGGGGIPPSAVGSS